MQSTLRFSLSPTQRRAFVSRTAVQILTPHQRNIYPVNASRFVSSGPVKLNPKDRLYTAIGVASGNGWNGQTESGDMKLTMALPPQLGGTGKGSNPEQLFALGYSCCFLGSLKAVAEEAGQKELVKAAVVNAKVHMGKPDGYALGVELEVVGAPQHLVDAAHEYCPFSLALKHGVEVTATAIDPQPKYSGNYRG